MSSKATIPKGMSVPDSTTIVLVERRPLNPPSGSDGLVAVSNFEWSFEAPGSPLNWTSTFGGTNYYNNVFLPMC